MLFRKFPLVYHYFLFACIKKKPKVGTNCNSSLTWKKLPLKHLISSPDHTTHFMCIIFAYIHGKLTGS